MSKKKKGSKPASKPKQARLAGMEDPKIEQLESLAEEYADIRDQRIALTPKEVDLNKKIVAAMKANGKTKYHHNGITISVVHEKEKAKVKIDKSDSD